MRRLSILLFLTLSWSSCSDDATPGPSANNVNNIDPDLGSDDAGDDADTIPATASLKYEFSDSFSATVKARIESHLSAATVDASELSGTLGPNDTLISFGGTVGQTIFGADTEQRPEGFSIRTVENGDGKIIAVSGADSRGELFGAYRLLEEIGFAFYHPLAPTVPDVVRIPDVTIDTAPRWPIRGLQIHTMHPLELTHLLQGWGPNGPDDEKGWRDMLPEWEAYLEWSLANGQNRVQWVWLSAPAWEVFADSQTRIDRMRELVDMAHAFEIEVGLDVPIVLQQQHAYRLIRTRGTLQEEISELESRIDYVMQADFDYLATESGTTEFTAPEDVRMVEWMDAFTDHMDSTYGKQVFIKVHASAHQEVENFQDRDTGQPLNFNFLPTYADERLGVFPHTVQHYAIDVDPAPTYGNEDFGYIREFLQEEVGVRPVVWHPETAYWVSFDVDVPIFLPVYADRRIFDLRLLGRDEDEGRMGRGVHAGKSMDGQMTFSSGWEWGYWVQEVLTARASWDPRLDIEDDTEARNEMVADFSKIFGDAQVPMAATLTDYMTAQRQLLIEGDFGFGPPDDIVLRNGQAYLQGVETWDDVADLAADWVGQEGSQTQPDRLGMVEMRSNVIPDLFYDQEVRGLLSRMAERFQELADQFEALRDRVPEHALPLYEDIVASARITALRAIQVYALYDFVDAQERSLGADIEMDRLQTAQDALDQAQLIVEEREQHYRVPADRIAAWTPNPTAYEFGYLWTTRTLFYWWRDEGKAVTSPINPCYLNIINPVTIGFGEGDWSNVADIAADVFTAVGGLGSLAECLGAPNEPTLPPAGLR